MHELRPGVVVRPCCRTQLFYESAQVVANFGSRATAVKIKDITNSGEWELYEPSLPGLP